VIRRIVRISGWALALSLVHAGTSIAQTSLQVPLQFDFINPGAKSLAMGGAFAGLADDATASFANPAGLTFLGGPEVSVEFRGGLISSPFMKRGRLSGAPSGLGIDTQAGVVFENSADNLAGVSYLSLVYPHRSRRWVVAGYRHELARVDQRFSSDGVFGQDPTEFTPRRDTPQDGDRTLAITGYGVAGAYKVTPTVSIGAALVAYHFDYAAAFKRYFLDDFFGAPNRSVPIEFLANYTSQSGSDVSLAPVIGGTWDRGRARVGVVYRHGATFDFETTGADGASTPGRFRVPHTAGAGVSFRVSPAWLVSGEVRYINYARLQRDWVTIQSAGREGDFGIDNGTEVHGSAQYAWRRQNGPPVRLRAGAWFDPDHSVHFRPTAPPTSASQRIYFETYAAALSRGGNQVHVTGGVGITLTPRVELNAGFDLADTVKFFSSSLIVHLGDMP
jgi:hypothetical protein